ncbi:MAG: zinc ribbon domain-containing protein [Planctomycetota bacterium]|nr:MAG: zinc ribbon domain-containing protein [Planctomycetota bacterium]
MPFYEYRCEDCQKDFELLQKIGTTEAETICPHCRSGNVRRKFSPFSSRSEGGSDVSASPSGGT